MKDQAILDAVLKFKKIVEEEGATIDISNININKLKNDVENEYECGADGSIFDVISDLNDTVGLEEYGIIIQ